MLDANGVDDVHIIVATCLHRKMTEPEMRRMVGRKIHDAFYPGPLLLQRRRGPRRLRSPGDDRAQGGGQHPPARGRERPRHLRQHQLRPHGRRPQVGDHRPRRLRGDPAAPRADDDALVGLHGPQALDDEHQDRAAGGHRPAARERLSHRDGAEQPDVRRPDRLPVEERGRVHRDRSAEVRGYALEPRQAAGRRQTEAVSGDPVAVPDDRRARRQDRAGARQDPGPLLRAVRRPRARPGRHPHLRRAVHQPLQRQFDPEPDPGSDDGARVLPQHVPRQAGAEEGRGDDPDPPRATTSSITSSTRATSSSSTGSSPRRATRWSCTASTRRSSPRTRATSRCTGAATPTTAFTRSTCGTGASTAASTSAR